MSDTNSSLGSIRNVVAALWLLFVVGVCVNAQIKKDPHRPACSTVLCRKIRFYLRTHYCGQSPFGNGPADGCDIKFPKLPRNGVTVLANYHCEWNESKKDSECKQNGHPSASVRSILFRELERLGLPPNANGQTHFDVLKPEVSSWSVASAAYSRTVREEIELCQVIVTIDQNSHVTVLRELPFQKTDIDIPQVTEWSLVDLADVNGDGQVEIILEGDAYENHWLEVVSLQNESPQTFFSGLGYYL
jgi:hypothetical protein